MFKPGIIILVFLIPFLALGQTASFTYQSTNGLFCSPVTVNFQQTASGTPLGFSWNFGNGQTGLGASPSLTYTAAGTYTVRMVAVYDNSTAETTQTVTVNPAVSVSVAADRNYICRPGIVNFTAASAGNIVNYSWDFGDGSAIVNGAAAAVQHNYAANGTFTATVKATAATGCAGTATTSIAVQNPPVTGTVSPVNGCVPAPVSFTANATVPAGDAVANYAWNFGDGNTITTTGNSTTHSYPVAGSYSPTLNITTAGGCTGSFSYPAIAFGTPPLNQTAYSDKTVYCGSETPVFVAKAVNANSYSWDFGDGTVQTISDTTITHRYTTLGTKNITVTPYYNGCAGTPSALQIDIVGVIAGYTFSNTCSDKRTFSFVNTTQGNQSTIVWNFNDGSPASNTANVTHTFPASGNFPVSLAVTDNITGCTDTYTANIFTAVPVLNNNDLSLCRNTSTVFTIQNNYQNSYALYTWNVVGLPAVVNAANPYTVNASVHGNFTVNNVIINNGGQFCPDTIYLSHPILVRGPNLSFSAPATACAGSTFNITNTSSAFVPADSILLYYWNYGTGTANDTIQQPAPHAYSAPGTYTIKLFAKDRNGCTDSLAKQVTVDPVPFLLVISKKDTLCQGDADSLITFHSDPILWTPSGQLSCNNCDTAVTTATTSTDYIVTSSNSFGCIAADTVAVKIYEPFTGTPVADPVYVCLKDSVVLQIQPAGKKILWTPAAGLSSATAYDPLASPTADAVYTAALTDSAGCFSDTTTINVIVKSLPLVNAGPDQVVMYASPFTITPSYGANVVSYLWTPAAGLSCSTCAVPSGVAFESAQYTVVAVSDSNCRATDAINIYVECKYANLLMPAAFTPNGDGINDIYYPMTRGINSITKFIIYDRYGTAVFTAKDFAPNIRSYGWNGKYKGADQPPGTYVFVMEAFCDAGGTITKNGSFILLR